MAKLWSHSVGGTSAFLHAEKFVLGAHPSQTLSLEQSVCLRMPAQHHRWGRVALVDMVVLGVGVGARFAPSQCWESDLQQCAEQVSSCESINPQLGGEHPSATVSLVELHLVMER